MRRAAARALFVGMSRFAFAFAGRRFGPGSGWVVVGTVLARDDQHVTSK